MKLKSGVVKLLKTNTFLIVTDNGVGYKFHQLKKITELKNLKKLTLDGNQFESIPDEIFELENLEYLSIDQEQTLPKFSYPSELNSKIANLKKFKTLIFKS